MSSAILDWLLNIPNPTQLASTCSPSSQLTSKTREKTPTKVRQSFHAWAVHFKNYHASQIIQMMCFIGFNIFLSINDWSESWKYWRCIELAGAKAANIVPPSASMRYYNQFCTILEFEWHALIKWYCLLKGKTFTKNKFTKNKISVVHVNVITCYKLAKW